MFEAAFSSSSNSLDLLDHLQELSIDKFHVFGTRNLSEGRGTRTMSCAAPECLTWSCPPASISCKVPGADLSSIIAMLYLFLNTERNKSTTTEFEAGRNKRHRVPATYLATKKGIWSIKQWLSDTGNRDRGHVLGPLDSSLFSDEDWQGQGWAAKRERGGLEFTLTLSVSNHRVPLETLFWGHSFITDLLLVEIRVHL